MVSKTEQVQEQESVRNAKKSGTGTVKEHDQIQEQVQLQELVEDETTYNLSHAG